jgi:hypothetical protein
VNTSILLQAATQFIGNGSEIIIEPIGNGLIHQTYKAKKNSADNAVVLQAINTNVFKSPEDIVLNYSQLYEFLQHQNNGNKIPAPIISNDGKLIWKDSANNNWRATEFIYDSFSPVIASDAEAANTVAKSFASFTKSLAKIDIHNLKEIIPNFHNLAFRYEQFEDAINKASQERLMKSTHVIAELRQRKKLVDFFELTQNSKDYPSRVMHHDCKISNILFDKNTGKVICPVDLDTVMPGKFFSDLGDMIRSMACTVDENSTNWEEIDIRPSFYKAILNGYLEGIGNIFAAEEKRNIHYSGLILIYMQSLRFITDYLNNDIYYKINYTEQNLSRAMNQLILLEKLEIFLKAEFSFLPS